MTLSAKNDQYFDKNAANIATQKEFPPDKKNLHYIEASLTVKIKQK